MDVCVWGEGGGGGRRGVITYTVPTPPRTAMVLRPLHSVPRFSSLIHLAAGTTSVIRPCRNHYHAMWGLSGGIRPTVSSSSITAARRILPITFFTGDLKDRGQYNFPSTRSDSSLSSFARSRESARAPAQAHKQTRA